MVKKKQAHFKSERIFLNQRELPSWGFANGFSQVHDLLYSLHIWQIIFNTIQKFGLSQEYQWSKFEIGML